MRTSVARRRGQMLCRPSTQSLRHDRGDWRGGWTQAIGTSSGGRTSKTHCLADDFSRPVAIPLLKAIALPKRLLADRAYDADSLRNWLKRTRIKAAIPPSAVCRTPYPLHREAYRRRNVIERVFCKLKK
ncbi:transposase [Devosia honganensis]|uniref:Transposase n=1 Tax=Devosia honganensis TaxID=1610527 RepID=A0ABV7X140_9HYPH